MNHLFKKQNLFTLLSMLSLLAIFALITQKAFANPPSEESLGNTESSTADNSVDHYGELYVVADNVNLRASPSLQGNVLRKSKAGEVFFRLSNHHQDSYIRMKDGNGKEFWVHLSLVTPVLAKQ